MEVTKITTQVKNPNRVNLHTDGKFYRGLDKIVAMKLGLKQGMTLTPYLIDKLENTQTHNSAWETALRSLQRSGQSIKTLKQKLAAKFEPEIVDATIQKLVTDKILDDTKFARTLVERHLEQGIKSKRQIIAKLITKGVPQSVIQETIQGTNIDYEQAAALKLARYKNSRLKEPDWYKRYQKIGAYLTQRGFDYGTIKQVVTREALETEESV